MSAHPALVVGASRGFGRAVAEALGAAGWHVVAVARTEGGLEELDDAVRAAGGTATLAPMDIAETEAMRHLCRSIHDRWGGLGLWVHAAIEVPALSPADHIDARAWARAVRVNVEAVGVLVGFIAPLLAAGAGQAVHLDDPAAGKFHGAYAATKAAQLALFTAWAEERRRLGAPHVTNFTPRPMATALRARFYPGEDRAGLARPGDEAERLLAALGEEP